MANGKPKITIDKFSGAGQNGILFCEGFYPEVDNGKSVLSEGYSVLSRANASTTGFSGIDTIYAGMPMTSKSGDFFNLYIDSNGQLFTNQVLASSIKDGEIHQTANVTGYPDIIEAYNGDILYSSQAYIGRGFRSYASGGSTTTLVDTKRHFGGVNKGAYDSGVSYVQYDYVSYNGKWYACILASLNHAPTDTTYWIETVPVPYTVNDKFTNLKTGIQYTITSVTTTTKQNDTLNFTASGANTNSNEDDYILWKDNIFSIANTSEAWQPSSSDFRMQMNQYGSQIFFANGNYLGAISADLTTADNTYKQLPYKNQALCFGVNNSSILVSSSFNGKGAFLLWDGTSDGWNNILELDSPVYALTNYKSGWLFISKGTVYYTDGYQIQELYSINSSKKITNNTLEAKMHNSLVVYEDVLYCATTSEDTNFIASGVYALDISNPNLGFSLIRQPISTKFNGVAYSVFLADGGSTSQIVEVGGNGFINYLLYGSSANAYCDKSALMFISLPSERRITSIGLNLSRYLKAFSNDSSALTRQIQVSIGDGDRGLISSFSSSSSTTTTITINGETNLNNEIGDEVYVSDKSSSLFGERTFITAIANKGTTSEVWTVSPALSTTGSSDTLRMIRVKKLDRITLTAKDLRKEVLFTNENTGFFSNKLFIEIVVYGQASPLPININSIKIYGR